MTTWILNGILTTQDESRNALAADLRIEDGRIAEILPRRKNRPKPRPHGKTKVIDATGLTILPGFIQAHIHLCQTLFRNQADDLELLDWLSKRIWVMEAAHDEETLSASAYLGIHELLSSGTTCILDMGTVRHTEAIFEAVKKSGIRASVGKCLMDRKEACPPGLRESTKAALQEASDLFHRWNGAENDRIRVSFAPRFVLSCTETLLNEVRKIAAEHGAIIHTHAAENRTEIKRVQALTGMRNIEYLHRLGLTSSRLVLAHCIWLSAHEKKILGDTNTSVAHCPTSNLKLASGIANVPEMLRLGINVALGADGAPCNNNLDILQEMKLAALIQKPKHGPLSMRAQEVLDLATRGGAKALGWFDQIGSIEIGKKADLVALNLKAPQNSVPVGQELNPEAIASSVVYASQSQHVRWTMVDGRVLYQNGEVRTIPATPLLRAVAKAQRRIARRARFGR